MSDEFSNQSVSNRIHEASDVALHLTLYLANNAIIVENEDYLAVLSGQKEHQNGVNFDGFEFWRGYRNIVAMLPVGEDPIQVYYSQLYGVKSLSSVPENARLALQATKNINANITWGSLAVLVLLALLLAYVGTISELIEKGNRLTYQLAYFNFGDYTNAGYPSLSKCEPGDDDCLNDFETIINTQLESTVKAIGFFVASTLSGTPEIKSATIILQKGSMIIGFVNGYLIPLFAGALGASLAILRGLYLGIQNSRIDMRLFRTVYVRIALGTISGIAIGWMAAFGGDEPGTAGLTPLALAFAAGYAVELVFNLLDRIVIALGGPPPNTIEKRGVTGT